MKKKTRKILLSLLPVWSLTALAASCNNPAKSNDKSDTNQQIQQNLKVQLNTEANSYTINLKDNSFLTKLPSEIVFDNLQGINTNKNKDFVFQFTGNLVPDQSAGTLQVSYYIRALDPETKKWEYSDVKTVTLSGFKNDNNLTDEAIEQAKLQIKAFDYKTMLPSEASQRDFISLTNYNKELYKAHIELVPVDKSGYLCVYYKLENITSQYSTKVILHVIKGFKTTLEHNKEQIQANLNSQINSIALLTLKSSINKDETKASQITNSELVFPQLVDATANFVDSSFDDEKGTYTVKFQLVSTIYPELKSKEKNITISGFLTNGQIINKADNEFRKELHDFIVANPIAFQYKENENRDHTLPSSTNDADFKALNVPENLNIHIKSLNKDDSNGIVSIIYTVSRLNPETNNAVETNEEQVATINDFYTQRQLEIDTEQARLDQEISGFNLVLLDSVNKAETLPSQITKDSFDVSKLNQESKINISFEANDNNGELLVKYQLVSNKSNLSNLHTETKELTIQGFNTAERARMSDIYNNFELTVQDINLDASVMDKESFYAYYAGSKYKNEITKIDDKVKSLINKNIENVKIEIKKVDVFEDFTSSEPYLNLKFALSITSSIDPTILFEDKIVEVNILDLIAQKYLNSYIQKVKKVKLRSEYLYYLGTTKPSVALQTLNNDMLQTDVPNCGLILCSNDARKNDTVEIVSADDENKLINVIAVAHLGKFSARKNLTVNGFLSVKDYQDKLNKWIQEKQRVNSLLQDFSLLKNHKMQEILNNTYIGLLNKNSFSNLSYYNDHVNIIYSDFSVDKVNKTISLTYKLKSTTYGLIKEVISDNSKTETLKVKLDDTLFTPKYLEGKLILDSDLKDPQNLLNIKSKEYIPSKYYDKFNKESKYILFNGIQELFNKWNLQIMTSYINNTDQTSQNLIDLFEFLSNRVRNVLPEVTKMYSLGWPKMSTSSYGYTFETLRGYALGPILEKIWKEFLDNKMVFLNPVNNYVENNMPQVLEKDENQKLQNDIKNALEESFTNMYKFQLDVVDWKYVIDGTSPSAERKAKFDAAFPKYKPGRTYLTTNGWDRIFDSERDIKDLKEKIKVLSQKYHLDNEKTKIISDFVLQAQKPLVDSLQVYRNGIKKGFSSELLDTVLEAFKNNISI
ncbi:lipoprotein 17-related variable surface protein [Mycoplasma sp. 1458C]|uniref:lipoprotein 17-related variable surface protein n=1 Tax=Mycoplasma sp. 1458C TaxID=3401661 RepID=UPI003AAA3A94